MAIKIGTRYTIEGKQFDWAVTTHTPVKTKDGEAKISDRKHYFPRLTQIACFLVEEEVKLAGDAKALVSAITDSTAKITEVLAGIEERLSESGNKDTLESIAEGEVESNDKKEKVQRTTDGGAPRRRCRKKAAT